MHEIQIEIFSFLSVIVRSHPTGPYGNRMGNRYVRDLGSNALRSTGCGRAGAKTHREQDPAYRRLDINYITANTDVNLT
jgi:hypothetical protein